VNRPSTSSSAFFNDAAAKTVIVLSCAPAAGGKPATTVAAAKMARIRLLSNTIVLQEHGCSSFAGKNRELIKTVALGNHRSRLMRQALSRPHLASFRLAVARCRGKAAATRYHPRGRVG